MERPKKIRIDQLLVDRSLAPSHAQAKSLIMAGKVLVNDVVIDKPGTLVSHDANVRLKDISKYVSRGGLKLEKALSEFSIDVRNKVALDVGLSTGGFTDCLLQHGAKKIYGVDVGTNQLHWKIVSDARVVSFEKENFRHFDFAKIPKPVGLVVMDVSFISLKSLIPKVVELFRRDAGKHILVALIKPQFEVSKDKVGKGGIVRDEKARQDVVANLTTFVQEQGFENVRVTESPITGSDGNVEYLIMGSMEPP